MILVTRGSPQKISPRWRQVIGILVTQVPQQNIFPRQRQVIGIQVTRSQDIHLFNHLTSPCSHVPIHVPIRLNNFSGYI